MATTPTKATKEEWHQIISGANGTGTKAAHTRVAVNDVLKYMQDNNIKQVPFGTMCKAVRAILEDKDINMGYQQVHGYVFSILDKEHKDVKLVHNGLTGSRRRWTVQLKN